MINYHNLNYNGNKVTFSQGHNLMINATEMAKPFGRRPVDWMNTQQSKDVIAAISKVRNLTYAQLVYVKQGSSVYGGGTWFHEDVALMFAQWLAPEFYIWCNDQIKTLLTHGKVEMPECSTSGFSMPVPTEAVTKDDTIMMHAQRMRDKDYSISEVAGMIVWGKYHIPRRTFVGYLYEHGFLRTHETGVAYPTEMALALGLFCVIDKCKRGAQRQLKRPRVRITMDGANYFINVLQHGLRGVLPSKRNQGMINM